MFADVNGALSAVKTLMDMANASKDLALKAELSSISIELSQKIIASQATIMELQETVAQLKQENMRIAQEKVDAEQWSIEADQYTQMQVVPGVFAVVSKDTTKVDQSTMKFCANCYANRKKSILQLTHEDRRRVGLMCFSCKAHLIFDSFYG